MKRIAYTREGFAWARWNSRDITKRASKVLAVKRKAHENIKRIPDGERTFENTVYAIEASNNGIRDLLGITEALLNLSPRAKIRRAAQDASIVVRRALVDLEYDRSLYRAFLACAAKRERLAGADKKLLDDMRRDFRRMGLELPRAKQELLKRKIKELQKLESEFSENLNNHQDSILVLREELSGLPDRFVAGLRKRGSRYVISLDYPEYFPFMQLADNAERRKELSEKQGKKGGKKNLRLLVRMLKLRYENARLLGYPDHAAFQLEPRMARNVKAVLRFTYDLVRKVRPKARLELRELETLKRKTAGKPSARLEHYDIAYYGEKLRQKKFRIESEKVREYFPLETVKRGMFGVYEKLLGLKFRRVYGYPTWHKDVEVWRADNRRGGVVGYFMLDLYPRRNKYGHAAASSAIHGRAMGYRSNEYRTPIAFMMTNFPKPANGNPSLMSHGEVETLFHEFGHIMHQIVTTAVYASESGSNTVLDFVEAQSQMLENWVWDARSLGFMSGHYKNSREKLPIAMLKGLLRSKKHLLAYATLRQLMTGLMDTLLHVGKPHGSPADLYRRLVARHVGMPVPKSSLFPAGLGHIGGGYDAGYYGYLWSLVYAQDMFTKFGRRGILNPRVGMRYRREILEVGSSRPEMDSVMAFLGRKPNTRAFLRELGIRK
jgi:thimet oligopeptidase